VEPIPPLDTRLPALLRSGRRFRSIFNPIPAPAIVEMCAYVGFDVIIIDNEHGGADLQTTENMLRAARGSGIVPIVRCLEHDIARVLDLGASGVQIPMVNDAHRAADLVRRVRYPVPDGKGGVSDGRRGSAFSSRAAGFGAFGGPEHTRRSNDGIGLVLQVETPEGVANAGAIAAVPGVDSVFVGTNDLAHSMGHDNRSGDAPVQAAIEHAVKAIVAAGKCAGLPAFTVADEDRFAAWGARFFAVGTTGLMLKAFKDVAQAGK
jgi:4-hydroxy-2-oxoheptanedioate aldolase